MPFDAAGDVVVDEGDLLVDVGLGRAVRGHRDVAQLGGRVLHALGGGVEVADADQLGHVHRRDRLAVQVRRIGRLAAVIGLGRRRGRRTLAARQGIDRQLVRPVPPALRHGARRHEHGTQPDPQISQHACLPGDARPSGRLGAVMAQAGRGFKRDGRDAAATCPPLPDGRLKRARRVDIGWRQRYSLVDWNNGGNRQFAVRLDQPDVGLGKLRLTAAPGRKRT